MSANRSRNLNLPRIDIETASDPAQQQSEDIRHLLQSPRSGQLSPLAYSPESSGGKGTNTPGRSPTKRPRGYRPSVFAHRVHRRAVFKNGSCNIALLAGSNRRLRFLVDLFTTLVDARWRYTLMVFALGFVCSWLFFALLYWFICLIHGDLDEENLPHNQESTGWIPCISNIYTYTSCFLFSLETQHTIGYGNRATTEECPEAIFVMSMQSIHGVMIQALLAGIIFAKMTRPKSRSQTLLFSKCAVISMRDGDLCLMFRVGDLRKSHIIGANIRAQLIRGRTSCEGESMPQYQSELELSVDGCGSDLFFIWPQVVVHRINAESPLWNLSPHELLHERFEIVVVLEGTIESTGQSTQARSSYLNTEILWGRRFEPVLFFSKEKQSYVTNISQFNQTTPSDAPNCSAKEYSDGTNYNSNENLLDKRPFEFGSLVDRLERYHVENEQSQQQPTKPSTAIKDAGKNGPSSNNNNQIVQFSDESTVL
ncbi:ATP-sensitive inward rectifier potassium channel 11-like [Ochlerotatus camptorhynchus]|uniref:ATP-sensitive inward rectifier potassium channel 11-like n=1 Tax=Ochlerotatus camptorhynchus TaxID=644619 RepID=UPI0031D0312D